MASDGLEITRHKGGGGFCTMDEQDTPLKLLQELIRDTSSTEVDNAAESGYLLSASQAISSTWLPSHDAGIVQY
jgi:hypothetical protein